MVESTVKESKGPPWKYRVELKDFFKGRSDFESEESIDRFYLSYEGDE